MPVLLGEYYYFFILTFQSLTEREPSYMYEGFWACPVDDVFTLWYGAEPALANMPSAECVSIMLETSNHLF